MRFSQETFARYRQFLLYCVIGVIGVSLDYASYALMIRYLHFGYLLANCISVSLGISNNFLMNAFFNFRIKSHFFLRYFSFFAVGLTGLLISSVLLFIFVKLLGLNEYISKAITIPVVTVFQYALNRNVTFRATK